MIGYYEGDISNAYIFNLFLLLGRKCKGESFQHYS